MQLDLNLAFHPEDSSKIEQVLADLKMYFPKFALTGGLATSYYLLKHKLPIQPRHSNDIDVISEHPNLLSPQVNQDFLISHYHPLNKKGKFHIMVVSKEHKLRVDIFPSRSKAMERTETLTISQQTYDVLSAEDLACRLLLNCSDMLEAESLDPKYAVSLLMIFPICNHRLLEQIWKEYREDSSTFSERYWQICTIIKEQPQLLKKNIYTRDLKTTCRKCHTTKAFPLASNQEILDLLGYI